MKKPDHFGKRLFMTIVGVLLCAIAVGFFKCSSFGVDPFQCFAMGSWGRFLGGLPYGTYYVILNLLLLVIDLFLDRHYIGLATFINLLLVGYVVDFAQWVINSLVPDPTLPVRILFLLIGVTVMCFSSALYMTSDLGVSTYDAIPIVISNRTKKPFKFVRITSDLICVVIGTVCGMMPGIGTLITAFFMGPLVDFFNRTIAEPFLYGKALERS